MTRYHISRNGNPTVCKAVSKPCPLNSAHFESRKEAFDHIEMLETWNKLNVISEEDIDDYEESSSHYIDKVLSGNDEFNRRLRKLLKSDSNEEIFMKSTTGQVDVGGWGVTWEDFEGLEVKVGEQTHEFNSLNELITKLDFVDAPEPKPIIMENIGKRARITFLVDGKPSTLIGKIGNANSYQMLFISDVVSKQDARKFYMIDRNTANEVSGQIYSRPNFGCILKVDIL